VTEEEFRKAVQRDGYDEPVARERRPGQVNSEHVHEFALRLLVLSGEMKIITPERTFVCQAGESDSVDTNTPHTEIAGEHGVHFLAARKTV
jgi:quercetin dioxygenase-like cupin family protein